MIPGRGSLAGLILIFAASSLARAQEVLSIPGRPAVCRAGPEHRSSRYPSGLIAREFKFGAPKATLAAVWPREITVMFDSTGRVRYLSDRVSRANGELPGATQSVIALFQERGVQSTFAETVLDTVAYKSATAKRDLAKTLASVKAARRRSLTESEALKAKVLAAWLWKNRC